MNKGTLISTPVSKTAIFVALVAVLPFTPGSEDIISKTTLWGISTDKISEFSVLIIIVTIVPSFKNFLPSIIDSLTSIW